MLQLDGGLVLSKHKVEKYNLVYEKLCIEVSSSMARSKYVLLILLYPSLLYIHTYMHDCCTANR